MSIGGQLLRPLGILSVFVSLPILEASLMAASAFYKEGDTLRTVLGALGSVGAICLLIAGVSLLMKRQVGRKLALWGSAASIVAHMIGALIGLVGGHGVLNGVGFPVAIVLLLRAAPPTGLPIDTQKADARSTTSHDGGVLRAATVSTLSLAASCLARTTGTEWPAPRLSSHFNLPKRR
jgi:hypothetical protein